MNGKPIKQFPRNAQGEPIMSTGETLTEWSDRLFGLLVRNLNSKTKDSSDPERQPDDKPR